MTPSTKRGFLVTMLAALSTFGPWSAMARADDPLDDLPAAESAELAELRGGFQIGGLLLDFMVRIDSTVATPLRTMGMTTVMTMSEPGVVHNASTTWYDALPGGGIPSSVTVSTGGHPEAGFGIALNGPGQAEIMHRVSADGVGAIIRNSVDAAILSSHAQVTVVLPNFNSVAVPFGGIAQAARLSRDAALFSR